MDGNSALSMLAIPHAHQLLHAPCMPQPNTIRLYAFALSGHSHRVELVELFLSLLGLGFERTEIDLLRGEQKQPSFLAKSPFGQVPVIEHEQLTLADSNAILVYLATRFDSARRWLPGAPEALGQVQRWLSVAAGPLLMGPAAARLVRVFGAKLDLERCHAVAAQLLSVMEGQLAERPFLVGDAATLADVALYSYTARAPEGGVSLAPYPVVRSWLERIEALPGFFPMPHSSGVQAS
jgi:glutathione S-transferase